MDATFRAPRGLEGSYLPPPDKSMTHRALMLAAVSSGRCLVRRPLDTGDCLSTRRCLEQLGVRITDSADAVEIQGVGLRGFSEPAQVLDAQNSGTTARLLAGLLAGQRMLAVIGGDDSLVRRPMGRVVEPLRAMGARIEARGQGNFAPLCFLPGDGRLAPAETELPVPSAQVKSCILLAALRASGPSRIGGMIDSRDHTERMLSYLGVPLELRVGGLTVRPVERLPGFDGQLPGDLSSASFFVAASLITGGTLRVRACGINPTRRGFLHVARRMGATVEIQEEGSSLGEPFGTITIAAGALKGVEVAPAEVPGLIDEIPLLAVLGLFANGLTRVRGAGELRVKESDRLEMIVRMARAMGGEVEPLEDGFSVEGPQRLRAATVDPAGDHRIAMSAAVAGAGVAGGVRVIGFECSRVSYPDFARDFVSLGGEVA